MSGCHYPTKHLGKLSSAICLRGHLLQHVATSQQHAQPQDASHLLRSGTNRSDRPYPLSISTPCPLNVE